MIEEYRLTTVDNPFDPFDQFDEWLHYDHCILHRNTDGLLARFARTSPDLSDSEYESEINDAITKIINLDPSGVYKRVSKKR